MSKPFGDARSKPRALMLMPEAPFPVVGGGPLRTACIVHWLARRYDLDVIVFREPGAADPGDQFPVNLVQHVHVVDLPVHSREQWARAARNLRRYLRGSPPLVDRFSRFDGAIESAIAGQDYALGVIEHFWCARYGRVLRPRCTELVLDLHNIESVLLERTAATEGWPMSTMMRRFAKACNKLEHTLLPEFSQILVPSPNDKARTTAVAPLVKTCVVPNAIPHVPVPEVSKRHEIVFSGNLEYHPNVTAVAYFRQSIWPQLIERWPDLQWRIIGRNAEAMKTKFAGDRNIHVVGPVADAIEELAGSKVAVVPVLAGSGTRIKIIEAWAAGTPVVSTRIGAEGLPGTGGEHLLLADDPVSFAKAVSSLLEFPPLGSSIAARARALYEEELTWEAAWKSLEVCGL